ncbi:hypothetical protein PENSPDRAFT_601111 [Peniophora sp. CONT]|nr:hypothetical protein PENSPDRAFT_601111 [Peniophora sp. CONT]
MSRGEERSKEAPMEWDYTARPAVPPAWQSPQKRPHDALMSPPPDFNTPPSTPFRSFGENGSHTFLFNQPAPQTPQAPAWVPPSPSKSYTPAPDVPDVDMADASPDQPRRREIATGALRRVYRQRAGGSPRKRAVIIESESESDGEDEVDDELATSPRKPRNPRTHTTSHHYTLNMQPPAAPVRDLSVQLVGYLQVAFNSSLILLFLYCVIQIILTFQQDMRVKIADKSMVIVQEISHCAVNWRANGCQGGPVPAMVRQCAAWEACMQRDPNSFERSTLFAATVADVWNAFIEPISLKTFAFTILTIGFAGGFVNFFPTLYRRNHAQQQHNQPPQGPQHMPSYPPSLQYHPSQSPFPQGIAWAPPQDDEAPTRRRRLENGEVKVR